MQTLDTPFCVHACICFIFFFLSSKLTYGFSSTSMLVPKFQNSQAHSVFSCFLSLLRKPKHKSLYACTSEKQGFGGGKEFIQKTDMAYQHLTMFQFQQTHFIFVKGIGEMKQMVLPNLNPTKYFWHHSTDTPKAVLHNIMDK